MYQELLYVNEDVFEFIYAILYVILYKDHIIQDFPSEEKNSGDFLFKTIFYVRQCFLL